LKVVLFCGGLGTRIRDYSDTVPKPMVPIGYRPILWHLMKYYAHYGHKDFILCLGYKGDAIKQYFLDYEECLSNDFTMDGGSADVRLHDSDISDWRITFVDTGQTSSVGQRLKAVEPYLRDEEIFLANYSDGLSDLPLDRHVENFRTSQCAASFVSVQPSQTFHVVQTGPGSTVTAIQPVSQTDMWINGGFFALRPSVFDYMEEGEDLLGGPFQRLMDHDQLITYRHRGFWACMDTFREKQAFDEMFDRGDTPWAVWQRSAANRGRASLLREHGASPAEAVEVPKVIELPRPGGRTRL